MIKDHELQDKLVSLLETFHQRRLMKLHGIKLSKLLQKNPYLYRSLGVVAASDYIKLALDAFISSSDETIFGNEFFEPLAKWAASKAFEAEPSISVQVGGGAGYDISIESATEYKAIAVKSGTNIFNAQSSKQQDSEYGALQARIRKEKKVFHPIIGYGYGRKVQRDANPQVLKLAGQAFWTEVTGEDDFYLRMSSLLGDHPSKLSEEFRLAYVNVRNKLEKEFHRDFTDVSGAIYWDEVIAFSSRRNKPKAQKARSKAKDNQ